MVQKVWNMLPKMFSGRKLLFDEVAFAVDNPKDKVVVETVINFKFLECNSDHQNR